MKLQKKYIAGAVFVISLLASSCHGQKTLPSRSTPSNAERPAYTVTATPLDIQPPDATPIRTVDANILPTPADDWQAQLYELLSNNGDCELPCILGIVPGQTAWSEAQVFLESFTLKKPITIDTVASTDRFNVYFAQIQTTGQEALLLIIRLEVDRNDLIQHIIVDMEMRDSSGSYVNVNKRLSKYSLRQILRENGVPDEIYMKPIKQGIYSLHVVYRGTKMVIGITGRAQENSTDGYQICLDPESDAVSVMTIAVANPEDWTDVKTLLGYPFYESEKPIEQVTNLSIQQFYDSLVAQEIKCIAAN